MKITHVLWNLKADNHKGMPLDSSWASWINSTTSHTLVV